MYPEATDYDNINSSGEGEEGELGEAISILLSCLMCFVVKNMFFLMNKVSVHPALGVL